MSMMFPRYPSSPFQNVPSTPLTNVGRRERFGSNSPSSISSLQYQTLYSSPIPSMNRFVHEIFPVLTPPSRLSPSQTFSQEESVATEADGDIPLLTERAASESEIEQVVPASPHIHRSQEQLQDTPLLQIPFRTDIWTSVTPPENVASYFQESPEHRYRLILSQENGLTQFSSRTPDSSISRGRNVRRTPRRGIDNFRRNGITQPVADELETSRRQTVMLQRVNSLFVSRNAVQLDFVNQDGIFA